MTGLPNRALFLKIFNRLLASRGVATDPIDRAFIARAELTTEDLALVRTIVQLGQILGLRVVAEGIENAAQLDALRTLGCELGQGYHLCRPTDPDLLPPILGEAFTRTS